MVRFVDIHFGHNSTFVPLEMTQCESPGGNAEKKQWKEHWRPGCKCPWSYAIESWEKGGVPGRKSQ